ncbi:hypothetical protein F4809DRAFT_43109 [Biscogniauxia mediterranea]|nr:hypothetical protein F5X96DRAFT_395746 [Biscogniauxia mediterranea]KAI1639777.1 hypothetical protein F4809DRAFT_43109 [Biscogniauxia mediterranea]
MMFSPVSVLSVVAGLLAISNAALADSTPSPTIPGHCYTTIDDFEHTTGTVKTHECFTVTSTVPAATCPTLSCAPRPTDQICPQYIKVSSVTVPCATDCCPTTPTVLASSGPCPTCDPCRIPTDWVTVTTGCPGTPTITSHTLITPP